MKKLDPAPPYTPLWLKLAFGIGTAGIAAVYAKKYGPKNFLWFSDLSLAATAAAVITENPLLASIPAGILPLEIAWSADLLARGKLIGMTGYMYDKRYALWLRLLSLFHVALPPTLIWMLRRFGYDRRALPLQIAVSSVVLPLCYRLSPLEENINWVFGPGSKPQTMMPPRLYLALEMIALPVLGLLPMHLLLRRIAPQALRASSVAVNPENFRIAADARS